jgi:hypothetical protein
MLDTSFKFGKFVASLFFQDGDVKGGVFVGHIHMHLSFSSHSNHQPSSIITTIIITTHLTSTHCPFQTFFLSDID